MDEASRRLTFKGAEIAVIYYRAGYAPTDFTCDDHWAARLTMERSLAGRIQMRPSRHQKRPSRIQKRPSVRQKSVKKRPAVYQRLRTEQSLGGRTHTSDWCVGDMTHV